MEKKISKIITDSWAERGYLSLKEYIQAGGFSFIEKILSGKLSTDKIIREIEKSGLQGRGGGGFSTSQKWLSVKKEVAGLNSSETTSRVRAYFICNADESEPGTYKDRLIIEKSPFLVLEGLIIGAWATGANVGFIYVNNNYRETSAILRKCLQDLKREGLLGNKIKGSNFSLKIKVFEGAGSYVCGEETALINSIEGKRGEPKLKPPYPAQKGLFGKPTVVNNVETLANVPFILQEGGQKFRLLGRSENSFGLKLFSLNGSLNRAGLYEAPMGITLRELLEDYGGGITKGKKIKCIQIGGDAGNLYTKKDLDRPLGYGKDEISIGSGTILVVDDSVDLSTLLLSWSAFFRRESCGKCVPCREGTYQLYLLAERIAKKKTLPEDKEKLEDIIFTMQRASFCPFGKFAVNAWSDALKLFPKEI